jgi:hypothetical protein
MTPLSRRACHLLLTTAMLFTPVAALAQTAESQTTDTQPATDTTAETPETTPSMAEVEQAYQRGDFVFVRDSLKILAETDGTALAQYRYGRVLAEGRGGPRDMNAAAEWLQKAVDQNNNDAAVLLARIYLSAKTKEAAEAAGGLLTRAAARGHREGQYYLGLLHRTGHGVEKSPEDSFNWFLASAEQGFVEAQYELARAYSRGEGVKASNPESERWLTEAANNGHVRAQFFLANALDQGRGVTQDRAAALGWYRRAAEAGHLVAQRELGLRYLQGIATEANPDEALRWLTSAAKAGEAGAQVGLGRAYADGEKWGIARNDDEAVKWYRHASEQSAPQGMVALAGMQEQGRGMAQDLEAAVKLYRKAVEAGYPPAALRLGELAGDGKLDGLVAPQRAVPWVLLSAEQGNEAAVKWLEAQSEGENRQARTGLGLYLLKQDGQEARGAALLAQAAELGDVVAQFTMGELLTTGTGIDLDYVQAHKWFNIAAAQGHRAAAEQRATLGKLMTPEQTAEAQTAAREWFAQEAARVPKTQQKETSANESSRSND